jgi:hypothetical protein
MGALVYHWYPWSFVLLMVLLLTVICSTGGENYLEKLGLLGTDLNLIVVNKPLSVSV